MIHTNCHHFFTITGTMYVIFAVFVPYWGTQPDSDKLPALNQAGNIDSILVALKLQ